MNKTKRNITFKVLVWLSVLVLSVGGTTYYTEDVAQAEAIVYVTRTGTKYHTHKCGNGTFYAATLSEAEARGLTPCSKCFPNGYSGSSSSSSSSGSSSTTAKKKEKPIKLNRTSIVLVKGQSFTLKVSNATKKATWKSSKRTVATVSSGGKVVAKKKGKTTITATAGSQKKKCTVTVENPKLNMDNISMEVGESSTLKLKGCKHTVKWSTSDSNVVKVKKGIITAKGSGKAKVKATVHGKKFTCTVIVSAIERETESNAVNNAIMQ